MRHLCLTIDALQVEPRDPSMMHSDLTTIDNLVRRPLLDLCDNSVLDRKLWIRNNVWYVHLTNLYRPHWQCVVTCLQLVICSFKLRLLQELCLIESLTDQALRVQQLTTLRLSRELIVTLLIMSLDQPSQFQSPPG